MAKTQILLLWSLIALAGCSRTDSQAPAPTGSLTPVPTPSENVATTQPADECGAAKVGEYVGQRASEQNIAMIKAAVGHDRIRVIKPGMAVTMDYRADRLNVDVTEKDSIGRLYCS